MHLEAIVKMKSKLYFLFLVSFILIPQCKLYGIQDRFPSDNLYLSEKQNSHVSTPSL